MSIVVCARAVIALFVTLALRPDPVFAEAGPELFGPGKVSCQRLTPSRINCLLTSLRISRNSNNVATFSLSALPVTERALFYKWCSTRLDDCTVQLQGTRLTPSGSRLSVVTSVVWTRRRPPMNQTAARAVDD